MCIVIHPIDPYLYLCQSTEMEAKGQFDFEANESAELSFKKGDLLKVSDIHTLEPNNDSIYKSVITMIVLYC